MRMFGYRSLMKSAFVAAFLVSTLNGCRPKSESASRVQHDAGRFAPTDAVPWAWAELPPSAFDDYFGWHFPEGSLLDDTHPMARRLQEWVDKVDAIVRPTDPKRFAYIPAPRVKVLLDDEINGFAATIQLCSPFRVQVGSKRSAPKELMPITVFQRVDGTFGDPSSISCRDTKWTRAQHIEALRWAMAPYPQCQYVIKGNVITLSEQSECAANLVEPAYRYVHHPATNWIFIQSGMIRVAPEDEVVSVLTHELAHYYMGHSTATAAEYGQLYQMGELNPGQKPQHDPTLESLYQRATKATKLTRIYSAAGARYRGAVLRVVEGIVMQLVGGACPTGPDTSCQHPCAPLLRHFMDPATIGALGAFPSMPLPATAAAQYTKGEQLIAACAGKITMGSQDGPLVITPDLARDFVKMRYPWTRAEVLDVTVRTLDEFLLNAGPRIDAEWERVDAESRAAFQEVLDKRVGRYTIEQEANEVGAELLYRLGLPISVQISAEFRLDDLSALRTPTDIPPDRCRELYRNGWRDESGRLVFPPTNFERSHHSHCYMAFVIDRESKSHNYPPYTGPAPQLLAPGAWKQLVSTVRPALGGR